MSLTVTGLNVSHKPIIVTGSYTGSGASAMTTLPLGFVPTKLVIIDSSGNTWEWGYGLGWYTAYRPVGGGAVTDQHCIFQYLGKELEDNPGQTGDDYAEPFVSGDDEAGVFINGDTTGAIIDYPPDVAAEVYVFWAIG